MCFALAKFIGDKKKKRGEERKKEKKEKIKITRPYCLFHNRKWILKKINVYIPEILETKKNSIKFRWMAFLGQLPHSPRPIPTFKSSFSRACSWPCSRRGLEVTCWWRRSQGFTCLCKVNRNIWNNVLVYSTESWKTNNQFINMKARHCLVPAD